VQTARSPVQVVFQRLETRLDGCDLTNEGVGMRSYTQSFLCAAAVLALGSLHLASAQSLSEQDNKFLQDAAKGGMMEVHMGQLGLERGASPAVKALSQHLVNDHSAANKELAALAKQKGVSLPGDDAQMAASLPFATKNGDDFDKAFARTAVEDHQKDIAEFEKEARSGNDPDLKNWASKTLPTLRAHLAEAQALPK
jgi:putative membrane protein